MAVGLRLPVGWVVGEVVPYRLQKPFVLMVFARRRFTSSAIKVSHLSYTSMKEPSNKLTLHQEMALSS